MPRTHFAAPTILALGLLVLTAPAQTAPPAGALAQTALDLSALPAAQATAWLNANLPLTDPRRRPCEAMVGLLKGDCRGLDVLWEQREADYLADSAALATPDASPAQRDLAAALAFAGLARQSHLLPKVAAGVQTLQRGGATLKAALRQWTTAELAAGRPRAEFTSIAGLLRQAVSQGQVTDVQVVELLIGLTPEAGRLPLAGLLAQRFPGPAGACLESGLKVLDEQPEGFNQAAALLQRLGRYDRLQTLYREQEGRVGYPERRRVRLALFEWLAQAEQARQRGQQIPPELPTVAQERQRREGAGADWEARFALADLDLMTGGRGQAAWAYQALLDQAPTPADRVTVWLAWAEAAPAAAWSARSDLPAAAVTGLPVSQLAVAVAAVGLVAKDVAGAAQALSALAPATLTEPGVVALATALAVLAPDSGLTVPQQPAGDDALVSNLLAGLLDLRRGRLPAVPMLEGSRLLGQVTGAVRQLAAGPELWRAAASVAVQSAPQTTQGRLVAERWSQLMVSLPPELADADRPLLDDLTAASLVWLVQHPADRTVAPLLIQSAAMGVTVRQPLAGPAALALFDSVLGQCAARKMPLEPLRYPVTLFLKQASAASQALGDQARDIVTRRLPALLD